MPQNHILFVILALFFSLSAEQASAQISSRSFKRQMAEYREERAEDIEKFKKRIKKDRTAMAKSLKQCDVVRGSIDTNAEYFILYSVDENEEKDELTKELNEKLIDLKKERIQCVLFSSYEASEKGIKKFLSKNKIRIPMINRTTIYENAYKYSAGNYKRVYPLYYLYYVADFHYSYGKTLRVHWKNGEKLSDNASNLTEALEIISKHKEKDEK